MASSGPPNQAFDADAEFPPLLARPHSISTGDLALALRQELDEITTKRFQLNRDLTLNLTHKWETYRGELRKWYQRIDAVKRELEEQGTAAGMEDAKWLSSFCAVDPKLYDPNHFKASVSTGAGQVQVYFIGKEQESVARDRSQSLPGEMPLPVMSPSEMPGPPAHLSLAKVEPLCMPQPQRPLSVATSIEMVIPVSSLQSSISFAEAARKKLWVSWSRSGAVFCIECPCQNIITPKAYPGDFQLDYELVPRHFHTDPFQNDHAIRHFTEKHRGDYLGSMQEIVQRYGKRVTSSPDLSTWTIAAINQAAQSWYDEAWQTWKSSQYLAQMELIRSQDLQVRRVLGVERTVDESLAMAAHACLFQWPEPDINSPQESPSPIWAVFCTYPDCSLCCFQEHPLQHKHAIDHFAAHGMSFYKDYEVLMQFGFKVTSCSTYQPRPRQDKWAKLSTKNPHRRCTVANLDVSGHSRAELELASASQGSQRQNTGEGATPIARLRKCSTNRLRQRCKSLNISTKNLSRSDMISKLLENLGTIDESLEG